MVTLEKVESDLFPSLYDSFLVDDDPLSDEQDWRNVFDYQWEREEDHCGYAMLDDGEVVGMMGMVFRDRLIDGETRKFCNLHTWWVREDYRGRSLAMLRPILSLKDYTVTHFTPCDIVRAVSKRMGFQDLSLKQKILLPNALPRGSRASKATGICYDEQAIAERLLEHDLRILTDHQPYGCGHLLIRDGSDYCYLLYTHVVRHWVPYCHIHYISNKQIFAAHEPAIRNSLIWRHKARFVTVDARLTQGMKFPFSVNSWSPSHGLYRSPDVRPDQIDNLYSDVVFLKLTVLPDTSHELAQFARRLWPWSRN